MITLKSSLKKNMRSKNSCLPSAARSLSVFLLALMSFWHRSSAAAIPSQYENSLVKSGYDAFTGDINGDGYPDVLLKAKFKVVLIDFEVSIPILLKWRDSFVVLSNPDGSYSIQLSPSAATLNSQVWQPGGHELIYGDTDGDGSQELLVRAKTAGSVSVLITSSGTDGNPTLRQRLNASDLGGTDLGATGLSVDLLDTEGDGRADLMTSQGIMVQSIFLAGSNGLISPKASAAVLPTVAGATAGQFNVSSSGSATYEIPIWMPPGPNGMQPSLSLHYDSRRGRGTMGPGWSLKGLGAISRCNKTFAQDTTPSAVTLAISDGYCLNGSRLRLTSGNYGAATSTYEAETADFSQVTAYGVAGNGPEYFVVRTKDGLTYEYGNTGNPTNNARVTASGSSTPYQWLVNKVIDRNGNNYLVNYGTGGQGSVGVGVPMNISYTPFTAGAPNYRYNIVFTYTPDSSDGTRFGYVAGGSTINNNLLSRIEVKKLSPSESLRSYSFGYELSPTTNRSRLISLQECAGPDLAACLAPTSVTYQNGGAGVSTSSSLALASTTAVKGAYDFNGDGSQDILYTQGSVLYVLFANSTGYGAPVSTGINLGSISYYDAGDLVASGRDDIFVTIGSTWYRYYWNGYSFVGVSSGVSVGADERAISSALVDMNGDGLLDLLTVGTTGYVYPGGYNDNVYSRVNTSLNGVLSFSSSRSVVASVPCDKCISGIIAETGRGSSREKLDFNGDGRNDIAIKSFNGSGIYQNYDAYSFLISNGSSFQLSGPAVMVAIGSRVLLMNWNDDKCTDYIANGNVVISACSGFSSQTVSAGGNYIGVMDWNSDGRGDLLLNSSGNIGVRLSTGSGVGELISTSIPIPSTLIVFDKDGDGQDDLASVSGVSPYPLTYRLHNTPGTPPDLATSITDGFGINFSPAYISIAQGSYTRGGSATPPERDIQAPIYVVKQFKASDGIGGTYTKSYAYSDARENIQGRGFSGFGSIIAFDSRPSSLITKTYYKSAFPHTGFPDRQEVYQNSGTLISQTISIPAMKVLSSITNQQRYLPYVASAVANSYEAGGSKNGQLIKQSNSSYVYDDYGNVTWSTTTVTDKDAAPPQSPTYNQVWTTTVQNTFAPNTANWCLGMPTQTITTRSATGASAIARTTAFTPDYVKCRLSQQVIEPNSLQYRVTVDYGYDLFGNPSTQTVTGIDMLARTTSSAWGATGQFPTSTTNALGQSSSAAYDYGLGVLTVATDPNEISMSWAYDAFGRLITETRPDGTSTAYSYNKCSGINGGCQNGDPNNTVIGVNRLVVTKITKAANGTALRDDWVYLDQFGRTIVSKSKTLTGSYSRVGTEYDPFGRLYRRTEPCDAGSCSVYWITNYYDQLNRPTDQSRQISALDGGQQVSSIAYQGLTTVVTDPYLKTTTKSVDPNGWLRRSKDHDGYYQLFTYDAFGSLTAVTDSQSNNLFSAVYSYGIAALRRQTVDMDLGTWGYVLNALGEVVSSTDANGNSFSQTYDKLSRPLTRTAVGEGTTTLTWGNSATSDNIGQLASITSTGGTTETYSYDSKGRINQTQIVADGTTYTYNASYNATTGSLDTLTYPASIGSYRVKLQYGYQNGLLKQISDSNSSSTVIWQASAMNPRGQITQETLGNGVVINSGFDAVNGRLATLQAGIGGGNGVQNESYLYDKLGNVTERKNIAANLTETFLYDNLYRLDNSKLNGATNLDLSYDVLGNITMRCEPTCGSTWTYHATKKHAVTQASIGSNTYSYEYDNNANTGNGNVTSRNGYAITWNKDNYPTQINGANESVALSYDASFKRWKQTYTQAGVTETTLYIGGLLEKVTKAGVTTWRHSIQANGKAVALAVLNNPGTNTIRYMLEDHQGSVAKILNTSGATVVSESFTVFGARRNASTWSGAPSASDLTTINSVTRSGYTGHDALGALGLNHMNGRVQDAITGRFLSADPFISDPGNTQNYNRYSYVLNNPITFTDPSGFEVAEGTLGEVVVKPPAYVFDAISTAGGAVGKLLGKAFGGIFGGGGSKPPPPPPAEPTSGSYIDEEGLLHITVLYCADPLKCAGNGQGIPFIDDISEYLRGAGPSSGGFSPLSLLGISPAYAAEGIAPYRINLRLHEDLGGHTITDHVAQSVRDLQFQRAGGKGVASSFYNLNEATSFINATLNDNFEEIQDNLRIAAADPRRKYRITIYSDFRRDTGYAVSDGSGRTVSNQGVFVILDLRYPTPEGFLIKSAFPVPKVIP